MIASVQSMTGLIAESIDNLHNRKSAKWRSFDKDVLPLPVAEMDFPIAQPIKDVMIDLINTSDLGYGGIVPELPQAFAAFAQRRWNWTVDTDQFRLATDVGVAGVETLRMFAKPGDKVVINTPVYHNLFNWISEVGCVPADVPLVNNADGSWSLDVDGLRSVFASGVSVYILCHPHNPVGHIFTRSELEAVATLANEFNVTVISDEIHAPLIYGDAQFIPFLALNDDARKVGVCITAASKAWNLAGTKCAQIITQDAALNDKLSGFPINVPWRSSLLGAWAAVAAYRDSKQWLDDLMVSLDHNRKLIAELLAEHLPKAKYEIPDSTYLAWIDLRAYEIDNPAELLLDKARVALNNGADFGPAGVGYVRLNFATSPEIITEAITRMAHVLEA